QARGGEIMGCRKLWTSAWLKALFCTALTYTSLCDPAGAAEPESYRLIVSCKNDAAVAEIYAPERISNNGFDAFFEAIQTGQRGYYALDLNEYGKGKVLEPATLRASKVNKGVEVDQFTRGLPPTTVPKEGGTVSFDTRFATSMVCSPLFETGTGPN